MPKIRLTKSELKKQKESLKRYEHYLPILQLKKQQLQMELNRVEARLGEAAVEKEAFIFTVDKWVAVFGEDVRLGDLIKLEKVVTDTENIAGVEVPVFVEAVFAIAKYDLLMTPLWVDDGIEAVKKMMTMIAKEEILEKQRLLLREELRTTTQRVNLFEKVKIPAATENIRKIVIFLGDLDTAAVVTGKFAKQNVHKREAKAAA